MRQTSPRLAVLAILGIGLGIFADTREATAQFDFFYGPSTQPRASRPRRRVPPAPRPLPLPPRAGTGQLRPAPTFPLDAPPVAAPLPPPRPRFPDDAPAAGVTPVPEAGAPRAPAEMQKPAEARKPPPEKPSEPVKPQLPSRPAPEAVAPAPPDGPRKPSGPQPPVVVQPVPDELPAKGPGGRPPGRAVAPSPREDAKPQLPDAPSPAAPAQPLPAPSAGALPANPPLPPVKPPELAKPAAPGVAPSGARLGETPRQPEDDAACQDRLKTRNVIAEPATIGPQPDERCTVVRAVRLVGLSLPDGGKVEFPEHPTIACTTAETFSTYVRDLLAPLAKGSFGSTVTAVWTGPGLECRSRDHILGAKLSAHGQGLAIDIAQLKLADGRKIEVGDPKGDTGQAFESAARAGACGYFHTVLGPGSDSYHRTHWHFDLIVRGAQGDSKYCK